jgi:hypothetical protein
MRQSESLPLTLSSLEEHNTKETKEESEKLDQPVLYKHLSSKSIQGQPNFLSSSRA